MAAHSRARSWLYPLSFVFALLPATGLAFIYETSAPATATGCQGYESYLSSKLSHLGASVVSFAAEQTGGQCQIVIDYRRDDELVISRSELACPERRDHRDALRSRIVAETGQDLMLFFCRAHLLTIEAVGDTDNPMHSLNLPLAIDGLYNYELEGVGGRLRSLGSANSVARMGVYIANPSWPGDRYGEAVLMGVYFGDSLDVGHRVVLKTDDRCSQDVIASLESVDSPELGIVCGSRDEITTYVALDVAGHPSSLRIEHHSNFSSQQLCREEAASILEQYRLSGTDARKVICVSSPDGSGNISAVTIINN